MQIFCLRVCYIYIITISLILSSVNTKAQTNSIYSRYGLGDLQPTESVHALGMGGACVADNNPIYINLFNPASYSNAQKTTLQFAAFGERNTVRSVNTLGVPTGTANINYLNLLFPVIKNKIGVSIGFIPKTRMYYNLSSKTDFNGIDSITKEYNGQGGLQAVYVGTAYKYKGLSLGGNIHFNFGNFNNESINYFSSSSFAVASNRKDNKKINGLNFDLGAQYEIKLKHENKIKFGAVWTPSANLNADRFRLDKTLATATTSIDTLTIDSTKGKIILPGKLGFGASLDLGIYWRINADYIINNWSDFAVFKEKDSTKNSGIFRLGASFIPNSTINKSIFRRMEYKLGFFTGTEIVQLKSKQINTTGFTAGTSIPLRRRYNAAAIINLGIQAGTRGTTTDGLVKENFTRFNFGITFNDIWFLKYKYD